MLHFPQGEYRGDSLFPPQIKNLYHIIENCSPGYATATNNCGTLCIMPPRIPANETGMTDTKEIKLKNYCLLWYRYPPPFPSDFLCNWEWRASKYIIKGKVLFIETAEKDISELIKGLCIQLTKIVNPHRCNVLIQKFIMQTMPNWIEQTQPWDSWYATGIRWCNKGQHVRGVYLTQLHTEMHIIIHEGSVQLLQTEQIHVIIHLPPIIMIIYA